MKIVFNTRHPSAPASEFYREAFSNLPDITFSDRENYGRYDVALFMTYKGDFEDLSEAKKANPDLIAGIIDPRRDVWDYREDVDFLVIDSIEMEDFYAKFNKPMLRYQEYPGVELQQKKHHEKGRPIIAYHGNSIHLSSMGPRITPALEALAEDHDFEFWAIYNFDDRECDVGLPENLPVRHIRWHENVYEETLAQADIGIAPSCVPLKRPGRLKKHSALSDYFSPSDDDYLLRFKMPSNAGRVVVYGRLGLPVVAGFLPSFMQVIEDGVSGFLAYSAAGWYRKLEQLLQSYELRQQLGDELQRVVVDRFDFGKQNERLLQSLEALREEKGTKAKYLGRSPLNLKLDRSRWLGFRGRLLRESLRNKARNMCKRLGAGKIKRMVSSVVGKML